MINKPRTVSALVSVAIAMSVSPAFAQDDTNAPANDGTNDTNGAQEDTAQNAEANANQANTANADGEAKAAGETGWGDNKNLDADPEVPGVPDVDTQLVEQAGTGSETAFGSAGVVEVGGHGSVELASNLKYISLRPHVGWFLADNFQLSGILEVAWSQVELDDGNSNSSTLFGLYAEPSFHVPFNNRTLGFIGVGIGPTYDSSDFGFSVRPRLGLDVLLGRSGIFRPALEVTYSTVDVVSRNNSSLVGVSTTYGLSLGFSTML